MSKWPLSGSFVLAGYVLWAMSHASDPVFGLLALGFFFLIAVVITIFAKD